MSDMTVTTIELTPTSRLVVEYDQDAANPRSDIDFLTMYVNVDGGYPSRWNEVPSSIDADLGQGIAYADDHLFDLGSATWSRSHGGGPLAVIRWARIFHDTTLEFHEGGQYHRGYWFVPREVMLENWPDLVPGTDEYVSMEHLLIEQDRATYQAYVDGEVYGVVLERKVEWVPANPDLVTAFLPEDPTMDTWVEVEALWGNYLTGFGTAFERAAVQVGVDYFSATTEEIAAMRAIAYPEGTDA